MKRFPFGSLEVLIWGGWGEIGGNQILLSTPGGGLLLDFGKPFGRFGAHFTEFLGCLLYTSPSPRDAHESRMPSSA